MERPAFEPHLPQKHAVQVIDDELLAVVVQGNFAGLGNAAEKGPLDLARTLTTPPERTRWTAAAVEAIYKVLSVLEANDINIALVVGIPFACASHSRFREVGPLHIDGKDFLQGKGRRLTLDAIWLDVVDNDFYAAFTSPIDLRLFAPAGSQKNNSEETTTNSFHIGPP
jgi:hypothetical protein